MAQLGSTNVYGDLAVTGSTNLNGNINVNNITASGTLIITNSNDADASYNNSPALIIGGSPSSQHIEIDGNEILAKSSASAVGPLYLNYQGGDINCGGSIVAPQVYTSGPMYVGCNGFSPTGNWNEGIRLYGTATNNTWSKVDFGCEVGAIVGSHANQWSIGRNTNNQFVITHGTDSDLSVCPFYIKADNSAGFLSTVTASAVYNAVWNDLVDCLEVPEDTELEYGKCYVSDGEKYWQSKKYLEEGIIGIHSDTYGFKMGIKETETLDVAVSGFVLAYVDKVYKTGTPLTCGPNGVLTEMKRRHVSKYPERMVGIFWKTESNETWGTEERTVQVNGRSWIKVK